MVLGILYHYRYTRDRSHANITIRLYWKIDQFAKFEHANISNSTVSDYTAGSDMTSLLSGARAQPTISPVFGLGEPLPMSYTNAQISFWKYFTSLT